MISAHTHPEQQYLQILRDLLLIGEYREGRNGGTYSLFGRQIRFDLSQGFPVLTTKRVHFKSIVVELLWFLRGDTNLRYLHQHGVKIWDEWADENGDLGPVYGQQWRSWPTVRKYRDGIPEAARRFPRISQVGMAGETHYSFETIDQIQGVLDSLRKDPYGRRHIVSAWNPAQIDDMALPPCHCLFQFYVANGKLSCQLYQRSADVFLGVPFNIASYALLTHLVARELGLEVGEFIHTFGDLHLYANHVDQAGEQMRRKPRPFPTLDLPPCRPGLLPWDLTPEEFNLVGYDPHPPIKAEVSV